MGFLQTLLKVGAEAVTIAKNNKEKILLVGGLALGAATVGSTVRCTLRCKDIMEDHNCNMAKIHLATLDEDYANSDNAKKDIVHAYALTTANMAKEIAIPTVLGIGATACIITQHCMLESKVEKLTETVVGLAAAYTAIDAAFKRYRKNVVNELGIEADQRFKIGARKDIIEVTEIDENGKTTKHNEEVLYLDNLPSHSEYAKFFSPTNEDGTMNLQFKWKDAMKFRPDMDSNISWIGIIEAAANKRLKDEGYLFLNDVLDMLGMSKTIAGQVVGWIYDPENPNIDSYVSFGSYKVIYKRAIKNGVDLEYEDCILLDFNVDGPILEKLSIPEK